MSNSKKRSSANLSDTSSEQAVTQESISSSGDSFLKTSFFSLDNLKKIIPALILLTILAVFLVGLIIGFDTFKLAEKAERFRILFIEKIEQPEQQKTKTTFSENGKPLEMGLEQKGNKVRLIGKFEKPIFEQVGFNVARVTTENKRLLLIFSPSDWPIVTLFTSTGETSPTNQVWKGKTREELNEYIKEGVPFVARVEFPSPESRSWDSLTKVQQQYLEEIQNEIPDKKVGLVKNLIIYNK